MRYKLLPFLAIFPALMLAGCNDDDPVNHSGIANVLQFDIDDHDEVSSSTDLNGVWVAVLDSDDSSFARDDAGDVKYGEQSAKIYFVVKGGEENYKYANCFDTGTMDGDYDRGGYDSLTVTGSTVVFDADKANADEDEDDDLLSEEDDYSNGGTLTSFSQMTDVVFTFNDGDTVESNTFQMIKVNPELEDDTGIGAASFEDSTEKKEAIVACFAQWSGSYSSTDGYFTVNRFDASFEDGNTKAFSAAEYFSDDDDFTEYQTVSYVEADTGAFTITASSKSDDVIDFTFSQLFDSRLTFTVSSDGYNVTDFGQITIDQDLVGLD